MRVLEVALPLPLPPMSYRPPLGQEGEEALGRRVAVPWRGEVRVGVVVGEGGKPSHALRHAIAYLDPGPYLRPEEILFLEEASRYLFAPLGQVLQDFLPPFPELRHRVRLFPGADPKVLPKGLEGLMAWQEARGFDPKLLDLLREAGVLEEEVAFREGRRVLLPLREGHPDPLLDGVLKTLHALGQAESLAALARAAGVGVGAGEAAFAGGVYRLRPSPRAPPRGEAPGPLSPSPSAPSGLMGGALGEAAPPSGPGGRGGPPGPLSRGGPFGALPGPFPPGQGLPRGACPWGSGRPFSAGPEGWSSPPTAGFFCPSPPAPWWWWRRGARASSLPAGSRAFIPPPGRAPGPASGGTPHLPLPGAGGGGSGAAWPHLPRAPAPPSPPGPETGKGLSLRGGPWPS
ncbi:MAG: hypothetical protein ABDH20_04650 [Thermus sp.]